ncbi:hypothetical protein [Vreelandella populi]|uniref:Uncharacterized protein n=1 Tax=Vreelandella populi TaxID=2498858 RepID=A0A433L7Q0_9GAMM|nr:hypothetical protein [Halomonas populi]RUR43375.1 hypothetical protein ELY37_16795 [Halomonas populi]
MADSPISRLDASFKPVDSTAVRVGYFRGEHFTVVFDERRPKYRLTMDTPPLRPKPPARYKNFEGCRSGRLVAIFWWKKTRSGQASVWLVKCDCGRYEFRRQLSRWLKKVDSNEMCEVCEREKEMLSQQKSSRKTSGERTLNWAHKLKALGLTDKEISHVRKLEIDTKGLSAEQIRLNLYN